MDLCRRLECDVETDPLDRAVKAMGHRNDISRTRYIVELVSAKVYKCTGYYSIKTGPPMSFVYETSALPPANTELVDPLDNIRTRYHACKLLKRQLPIPAKPHSQLTDSLRPVPQQTTARVDE